MRKVYVLLMHTRTIPDRVIRVATRYKYGHVALSFNRSCRKTYSFGRRKVNSIINGGFVVENINGPFFRKFNKTCCKIFEVEVTNEQYRSLKRFVKSMVNDPKKYKYDYLGILLRLFRIPITFKNKYVCSYFVADALEKSSIYHFNKKTCFIRPKDFDKIATFKEIYSGNYISYC